MFLVLYFISKLNPKVKNSPDDLQFGSNWVAEMGGVGTDPEFLKDCYRAHNQSIIVGGK